MVLYPESLGLEMLGFKYRCAWAELQRTLALGGACSLGLADREEGELTCHEVCSAPVSKLQNRGETKRPLPTCRRPSPHVKVDRWIRIFLPTDHLWTRTLKVDW